MSVQDGLVDQEERERLKEALNRIHTPTITRVGAQDADVHWQELDTSEAGAPAGPFPQLDPSEFAYEIFLFENSPSGKLLTRTRCPPLSNYNGVRLTRLKPRTDYHVAVRASLPDRQLLGRQSSTAAFRTLQLLPDPPGPLKLTTRGVTWVTLAWSVPGEQGASPVTGYVLQMSKVTSAAGRAGAAVGAVVVGVVLAGVFAGGSVSWFGC